MSEHHQPNWPEAGRLLKDALEEYRSLKGYDNLTRAIDDIANYMPGRDGWGLSSKTVYRDLGGESVPEHRVELYVQWLYKEVRLSREWIAEWLEYTAYPRPGELLARVCDAGGDRQKLFENVKRNRMPSLRGRLWGRFLDRQEVMEKAIQWADNRRHPIAMLWGFGGNGKTTIQLKLGEDFVYSRDCSLRWPYEGVVWVSAQDFPRGQPSLLDILRKIVEAFARNNNLGNLSLGSMPPARVRQEAEKLLRKKRILILLDNFETVSEYNREEILKFFSWLDGTSQMLISSRYHLDLHDNAHVLILVDGLLPQQAEMLIEDYLQASDLPRVTFDPGDLKRLVEVTKSNPKTIITVLGTVEKGIALSDLLTSISTGSPQADQIFDTIIDTAWQEILTDSDKAVLMAKSFFNQPVSDRALGRVAGVSGDELSHAIKTLQTISFFDRPQGADVRVRTHPLAQDFAHRVLREHAEFESRAERRWWMEYAPQVVEQARRATYTDLQARPELTSDIINVLEHLEQHLQQTSPYSIDAAEMFAGRKGLGYALRQLGWWDEVLRVAEITLYLAIKQQNPRLIGECALNLISDIYCERNDLDKAHLYLAQTVEHNVSLGDAWLRAAIDGEQARIYRRGGFFKAAKQTYQNVLRAYMELSEVRSIATTLLYLGGMTIEVVTADLDEAVDPHWHENPVWVEVEEYFRQADHYWSQIEATDPVHRFDAVSMRAWRAVAARARGDMDVARQLSNGCIGQFQSWLLVARLYRELALVEHLSGNKDLAYKYEDQGLDLHRQMGVISNLTPYNCYKVIERMKKDGKW